MKISNLFLSSFICALASCGGGGGGNSADSALIGTFVDSPVSFRGRTLLTKLRVNDLTLAGAGYNSNSPEYCLLCKTEFETESILWFLARAYTRYVHCTILPFQCSWKLISNQL